MQQITIDVQLTIETGNAYSESIPDAQEQEYGVVAGMCILEAATEIARLSGHTVTVTGDVSDRFGTTPPGGVVIDPP